MLEYNEYKACRAATPAGFSVPQISRVPNYVVILTLRPLFRHGIFIRHISLYLYKSVKNAPRQPK